MAQFLIADTHFDDRNAIDYHMRPFNDIDHMNETLVHNWNRVVSHGDTVVILGDFTGPDVSYQKSQEWASLLNGQKKFILGNNDNISERRLKNTETYEKYVISYDDMEYYCTHKPDKIPSNWKGWGIHGHSHQLHPQEYPLYNYKDKRVNVSAEMIGYTPIPVSAIAESIKSIKTD